MSEVVVYLGSAFTASFTVATLYFLYRNSRASAHSTEDMNSGMGAILCVMGALVSFVGTGLIWWVVSQ